MKEDCKIFILGNNPNWTRVFLNQIFTICLDLKDNLLNKIEKL